MILTYEYDRTGEYLYPVSVIYRFLSSVRCLLGTIKDADFVSTFTPALNKALLKRFLECRRPDFEEIDLVGEKPFFELVDVFLARENLTSFPIRQAKDRLSCIFWLESHDPKTKLKGLALLREKLQISEIGNKLRRLSEISEIDPIRTPLRSSAPGRENDGRTERARTGLRPSPVRRAYPEGLRLLACPSYGRKGKS